MTATGLATCIDDPADFSFGLVSRQVRYFRAQVEDWYEVCRRLTDWEDRYLLEDPIPAQKLEEHARLLDELERVGRWLATATHNADFPDQKTAELVTLTLRSLADRRAMWHGNTLSMCAWTTGMFPE